MKAGRFKIEMKKFLLKNEQTFLNLGLKDYNIVGEVFCKEVRRDGLPMQTGRKFKKWNKPLVKKKKAKTCDKPLIHPVAEKLRKNAKKKAS